MKKLLKITEMIDHLLSVVIRVVDRINSPQIQLVVDQIGYLGRKILEYYIWPMRQIDEPKNVAILFSKVCFGTSRIAAVLCSFVTVAFLYLSVECFCMINHVDGFLALGLMMTSAFTGLNCIGLGDLERKKLAKPKSLLAVKPTGGTIE